MKTIFSRLRLSISFSISVACAVTISLAGCNSTLFAKKPALAADESRERMRWLEKDLRRKEAALQEIRERNLVLERRAQGFKRTVASDADTAVPVPFDPSAAGDGASGNVLSGASTTFSAAAIPVLIPAAKPTRVLPLKVARAETQVAPSEPAMESFEREQTGEQRLYSKVLETYRKHNLQELQKSLQFLLKTYPDSVYADNALYTAGLLAMELGDVARSHYYMTRVVREYPRGNKTVSALFAIAMIEKRKNKMPQAQNILKSLEHLYPGSPEAARAATEMKIIKKQASRSREG